MERIDKGNVKSALSHINSWSITVTDLCCVTFQNRCILFIVFDIVYNSPTCSFTAWWNYKILHLARIYLNNYHFWQSQCKQNIYHFHFRIRISLLLKVTNYSWWVLQGQHRDITWTNMNATKHFEQRLVIIHEFKPS